MDVDRAPSDENFEQDEATSIVLSLRRLGWVLLVIFSLICSSAVLISWFGEEGSTVYAGIILWTAGIFFMYLIWVTSFPTECSPLVHLISCIIFTLAGSASLLHPTSETTYGDNELAVMITLSIGYFWFAVTFFFAAKMARLVIQKEHENNPEKLSGLCLESLKMSSVGIFVMAFFLIQGTSGVTLSIHAHSEYTRHSPYCSYSEESSIYGGENCWKPYDYLDIPLFTSNTTFIAYKEALLRKTMLEDKSLSIIATTSTNSTEYITVHDVGRIDSVLSSYRATLCIVSGWSGGQILVMSLFAYSVLIQMGHMKIDDFYHLEITRSEAICIISNFTGFLLLVIVHSAPDFFKEYQYALSSGLYTTFFLCGALLVAEARSILTGKHAYYANRRKKNKTRVLLSVDELRMSVSLLRATQARRERQAQERESVLEQMRERSIEQSQTISRLEANAVQFDSDYENSSDSNNSNHMVQNTISSDNDHSSTSSNSNIVVQINSESNNLSVSSSSHQGDE